MTLKVSEINALHNEYASILQFLNIQQKCNQVELRIYVSGQEYIDPSSKDANDAEFHEYPSSSMMFNQDAKAYLALVPVLIEHCQTRKTEIETICKTHNIELDGINLSPELSSSDFDDGEFDD